jgi:TetR/AcrR family transcriptional regulator
MLLMSAKSSSSDNNNRARLLRAAADAFAKHGFEGASLRSIAEKADVSFQLIAYYFGTKQDLWVATINQLFDRYLETGKSIGFHESSNVREQFLNHFRILTTSMLQHPQMRRIWIQEYFADSGRYHEVVKPMIERAHREWALPYFKEVIRLGIVRDAEPEELAIVLTALVQTNLTHPHFIELAIHEPERSAELIDKQAELLGRLFFDAARAPDSAPRVRSDHPDSADDAVVYVLPESRREDLRAADKRVEELEMENSQLKQLIGQLTLEVRRLSGAGEDVAD